MKFQVILTQFRPGVPEDIREEIEADSAADALGAFIAVHKAAISFDDYLSCEAAEDVGPRPVVRLANWQEDPFNEASEGFLTNLAGQVSNLRDRLAHRPEYCTQAVVEVLCPDCQQPMKVRDGKYGKFYSCRCCGITFGVMTKMAAKNARFVRLCATPKEAYWSGNSAPYAVCPKCSGLDQPHAPVYVVKDQI